MIVTFVSECEKNALKKTRRVLDAFADRIGSNTWQTIITQEGLDTVKKMLRQTASKSTAVSCHWIRSRSRSEFLWVVGNKNKFNDVGLVPVNRTKRNLLNSEIENDWKYLPLIKTLTALAGLLHDWGKSSTLFQEKLKPNSKNKFKGDPIRHEWISLLLFHSLVNSSTENEITDKNWLTILANGSFNEKELRKITKNNTSKPLGKLPLAAQLIAWLIVSHHRLPNFSNDKRTTRATWLGQNSSSIHSIFKSISKEWGYENCKNMEEYQKRVSLCFKYPSASLKQSNNWLKQLKRWSNSLLEKLPDLYACIDDGSYRAIMHHARLCLMLGDHFYSSQDKNKNWKTNVDLVANTDRKTGDYKQHLDEHIIGVTRSALNNAHLLPAFEKELPLAKNIQILRKASPKQFKWQDTAVEKVLGWKKEQNKKNTGFFAVNMASTGCGKTFANAKVMRALSKDSQSLRFILALGLRTLTLQTGDEYRERIGLNKSQLAVLIGSKAVAELHNKTRTHESTKQTLSSESEQSLLIEEIEYECDIPNEGFATVLTNDKERSFLYAPVLTCTIDHLMSATETKRGGRYILPCLRLMSSDLVIDEIDDFTGSDLIAIGRLIHLAGMLGRKVMISSATIPPALAQGYFDSYKKGWQIYCANRDKSLKQIGCAWIDEFTTNINTIDVTTSEKAREQYKNGHNCFIDKRITNLAKQIAKRKAEIIACPIKDNISLDKNILDNNKKQQYFSIIQQAIIDMHKKHHSIDPNTQINISFGVVRVANISPCVELTKYLLQAKYPNNIEVKVMPYHSQQVLLLRHLQEKHLDAVLKRKEKRGAIPQALSDHIIRNHLNNCKTKNIIFILVATPVEEVGRDHDFDWAIVEPSSYRSIIQLAGRVRRHRNIETDSPNIGILQYNIKAYSENDKSEHCYFKHPGYENELDKPLKSHNLKDLIDEKVIIENLDATARIQVPQEPKRQMLASLEHFVIADKLANYSELGPNTLQGYLTENWFFTTLPQIFNPFRKMEKRLNIFLIYDSASGTSYFTEKDDRGKPILDINYQLINREKILNITRVELSSIEENNLWLNRDYKKGLNDFINEPNQTSLTKISLRFGELNIPDRENSQYEYNDQFGLVQI